MKEDRSLPKVCKVCGEDLRFTNYGSYMISKSIKPKGYPYRYKHVGWVCEECGDKDKSSLTVPSVYD